jgi:molecular chaperone GrpE
MAEKGDERFVDRRAASRMGADSGSAEPPKEEAKVQTEESEDAAPAEASNAGEPANESPEALKEQAERYYANWQRSAADFINYKRRVEDERKDIVRVANAALVINLLPVYDDLERAVNTVDAKLAGLNWVQGIEAIYRKFGHMLEAMGVQEIPAEGERFDPECHEAVGEQPGEDGRVLHVAQRGYRLGDKVIRPAMVIVGNGQGSQQ